METEISFNNKGKALHHFKKGTIRKPAAERLPDSFFPALPEPIVFSAGLSIIILHTQLPAKQPLSGKNQSPSSSSTHPI